jgi:hypothetical protein
MDSLPAWRKYEKVATDLLNKMADEFGLEKVEANQHVLGLRSGTQWAIDGKGTSIGTEKFVIVECRRYTNSKIDQERIGGLAYRISDTGASGGIIVTPIGLQEGAKKIAQAENIITVMLDENSSSTDYVMKFLNRIMIGVSGEVTPIGKLQAKLTRLDGTAEDFGEV